MSVRAASPAVALVLLSVAARGHGGDVVYTKSISAGAVVVSHDAANTSAQYVFLDPKPDAPVKLFQATRLKDNELKVQLRLEIADADDAVKNLQVKSPDVKWNRVPASRIAASGMLVSETGRVYARFDTTTTPPLPENLIVIDGEAIDLKFFVRDKDAPAAEAVWTGLGVAEWLRHGKDPKPAAEADAIPKLFLVFVIPAREPIQIEKEHLYEVDAKQLIRTFTDRTFSEDEFVIDYARLVTWKDPAGGATDVMAVGAAREVFARWKTAGVVAAAGESSPQKLWTFRKEKFEALPPQALKYGSRVSLTRTVLVPRLLTVAVADLKLGRRDGDNVFLDVRKTP